MMYHSHSVSEEFPDRCGHSLELIELSSTKKVSLVLVSSCSNTGSIRVDLYDSQGTTIFF